MPNENLQQSTSVTPIAQPADQPSVLTATESNPPQTVLAQTKGGSKVKNVLAIIIGVLIMIGGILAGVFLVQRQQDIREKAAEDVCALSPENCVIIQDPENSGSYKVDGIAYNVYLTDTQVRAFDLSVTEDGCYQVLTQGDTVYWNKVGTSADCNDLVSIQIWLTQLPSDSSTPVQSQCQSIKYYDTDWNLLTLSQINDMSAGDTIYLATEGTTTGGQIDQAKFSVNSTERSPVTTKKPGSNEFFDEYVIPAGVTQFNVSVQLHHSQFGWF